MKLISLLVLGLVSLNSYGVEIIAIGTSNTNCKNAGQAYTATLNELLAKDGVKVINAGKDGDRPANMKHRLDALLRDNPNTKLVILEPGPNERNTQASVEPTEEMLAQLQRINMPTVYVSHKYIQDRWEAKNTANKYSAYHYGHWDKDVPVDTEHRQYDQPSGSGHMTEKGCRLWANNILDTIKQAMKERNQ